MHNEINFWYNYYRWPGLYHIGFHHWRDVGGLHPPAYSDHCDPHRTYVHFHPYIKD